VWLKTGASGAVMNMVVNIRAPHVVEDFLARRAVVFSSRTPLHVVSYKICKQNSSAELDYLSFET
jgi:hypothetical protein